ncbi:hypothetical protein ACJX0J_037926, partial [Zea mays]
MWREYFLVIKGYSFFPFLLDFFRATEWHSLALGGAMMTTNEPRIVFILKAVGDGATAVREKCHSLDIEKKHSQKLISSGADTEASELGQEAEIPEHTLLEQNELTTMHFFLAKFFLHFVEWHASRGKIQGQTLRRDILILELNFMRRLLTAPNK